MTKLFKIFIQMFIDPVRGFQNALPLSWISALVPLVIVITATTLLNAYYYSHVDTQWLVQLMTDGMTDEQKRLAADTLTPGRLFLITFILVLILPVTIDALRASVFWVVLKVMGRPADYRRLFLITVWAAMPLTLLLPAGILNLTLGDATHTATIDVNPVSLNRLFFHFDSTSPWSQYFTTLTLVGFWEIALHAVGIKVATDVSARASTLLAVTPVIIVYGVWGLWLLLFASTGG